MTFSTREPVAVWAGLHSDAGQIGVRVRGLPIRKSAGGYVYTFRWLLDRDLPQGTVTWISYWDHETGGTLVGFIGFKGAGQTHTYKKGDSICVEGRIRVSAELPFGQWREDNPEEASGN